MAVDNIDFNLNEVFREILNRMETEGALDREAYFNFIDETLDDKLGSGEMDADANVKQYSESLQLMWPQAEALITKTPEEGYMVGDEDEAVVPPVLKDEED